ncbi:LPS assembly lipoprotein LptE [Ancylobacter moscoviensis]|nr:LPS assembly lipoprotein LptE [Ancylobacter moscoviensis]
MSSPDRMNPMPSRRRLLSLACAWLLAASTAGCFQPMYAETTPGQGSALAENLSQVEVAFAGGRVGNEVRNDLIFELTGGAGNPVGAPYRLILKVRNSTTEAAVVSPLTGLPEVELVTVDVDWQLFDVGDLKTPLKTGNAFGKASLDSGYQRFARARAIRDAENRSARVAAESIKSQLASFFVTRAPKS